MKLCFLLSMAVMGVAVDAFEFVNEDTGEVKGINLLSSAGSIAYPSGAVKVVSQDTSTVTVMIRQVWGATVDKFFYQYKTDLFNKKCFEEDAVQPDTIVDTITIRCMETTPVALLKLCLQDTTGSLLDPADDQENVPKCCHSDAPPNTPTVCYKFEIDCRNNTPLTDEPKAPTSTLISGQTLMEDQQLMSPNGEYSLYMGNDGNLVAYSGALKPSNVFWNSGTEGMGQRPYRFTVTPDGNAVIYDGTGKALWSTGTTGNQNFIQLQDDRNVVVYSEKLEPLWAMWGLRL